MGLGLRLLGGGLFAGIVGLLAGFVGFVRGGFKLLGGLLEFLCGMLHFFAGQGRVPLLGGLIRLSGLFGSTVEVLLGVIQFPTGFGLGLGVFLLELGELFVSQTLSRFGDVGGCVRGFAGRIFQRGFQ